MIIKALEACACCFDLAEVEINFEINSNGELKLIHWQDDTKIFILENLSFEDNIIKKYMLYNNIGLIVLHADCKEKFKKNLKNY